MRDTFYRATLADFSRRAGALRNAIERWLTVLGTLVGVSSVLGIAQGRDTLAPLSHVVAAMAAVLLVALATRGTLFGERREPTWLLTRAGTPGAPFAADGTVLCGRVRAEPTTGVLILEPHPVGAPVVVTDAEKLTETDRCPDAANPTVAAALGAAAPTIPAAPPSSRGTGTPATGSVLASPAGSPVGATP